VEEPVTLSMLFKDMSINNQTETDPARRFVTKTTVTLTFVGEVENIEELQAFYTRIQTAQIARLFLTA
jgi:hypothetical protein